ncbi:MAG TPA: VWA domain-containing protein [Vicinamibacterales bacterium]|nr:VWA domain-containing protein [Vicinamibacterales bacterium]
MRSRLLLALTLAVVCGWPEAHAQDPTPKPQAQTPPDQPVFRTGIDTVRVDVIVTDRQGNPVTDLKLEDFQIEEDGKPQKAETFRLIKIDTTAQPSYTQRALRTRNDEENAAADENSRIFMFFLDDYHVLKETSMSLKKPVIDFIANQLAPGDLVGVMHPLTPIDAAVISRNHQGVINAVERFEGRKHRYEPVNAIEGGYVYKLTPDAIEMIRRQVTFTAIRGICTKMGSLREGRKSLILVSEGYYAMLPPQMRSNLPGAIAGAGDITRDPFAGDNNPLEDRARMGQELDLQRDMQDVWDACNRNNTSIYAVDPRGLAVGAFDITANISVRTSQQFLNQSTDTLRELATNTDGRAIVNRNDLAAGMQQIIRDSSAYYLVGYTTQAPTDGKFHELKVRVKRPGVQVRHRKGFWAFTTEDLKRATAPPKAGPPAEVTRALAAIAPMTNRRYIRTWIGNDVGSDGSNRVTFLWEPLPPTPGVKRDMPRRVTVLATSASGEIVYRGQVPAEVGAPGTGGSIQFPAPAGKLALRLTIEGDGTGTLDSEDRELTLPDASAPDVRLSTPKVWFARNAREFAALSGSTPPAPVATREFRRTDRLLVRVDAYAPAGSTARVTAQLLNQQGTKMIDVPVTAPMEGTTHSVDLALASLAAGQYLLEITANSEGHKPVSELVAFRLGS